MVNLLSPKQRSALLTLYVVRLASVALFALAAAGITTVALIAPSYFVIHAEADQAEEFVATATKLAAERAKGQSQEALARFHESVTLLTGAGRAPSYAHILDLTTQERPSGVGLSSVQVLYDDKGNASVVLSGTARTRAELIAYSNALKKVPELTNVVVPVSALVADTNASFTVTATWMRPKTP
jgi:hypothetical protein